MKTNINKTMEKTNISTLIKNKTNQTLVIVMSNQYGRFQKNYNSFLSETNQIVTHESVVAWIATLDGFSVSTQRLEKTAIKQALESMSLDPTVHFLIQKEFKNIKIKKSDKKILTDKVLSKKDINRIKQRASRRVGLLIELLEITGLRISELLNIKHTDVKHLKNHCTVRIIGKGKKERTIYLSKTLLNKCKDIFNGAIYLIETASGKQWSRHNINKVFSRLAKKLDLHFTPHTLRHSFATNTLLENGKSLKAVSNYLGHSTTSITADMYIHDSLKPEDVLF